MVLQMQCREGNGDATEIGGEDTDGQGNGVVGSIVVTGSSSSEGWGHCSVI